ncbi:DUF2147 domain-containing protein [Rhodobacteraceae bacterium NNCM2]|nr:DUF2147 domain-containing protein [Coraliihabitans acroporae]
MRNLLALSAGLGALMVSQTLLGAVADEADVSGVWRTEARSNGSYITVKIHPCNTDVLHRCGEVVGAHAGARPELVGERLLRGLKPQDDGTWSDGEIVSPKDGKAYRSKLRLIDSDQLEVLGCVAGGLICSGQTWTRVR